MSFQIFTEYGSWYYSLFYRLSFIVMLLIFLVQGRRNKHPYPTLFLLSAIIIFFALIGTKLSAMSLADWKLLILQGTWPQGGGKSSIGALLCLLGIGIAQRWLRFRHSVLDLLAVAVPVALTIQRVGCFTAGCCFGKCTQLPWGISYGVPHHLYEHHLHDELVSWTSNYSLPVHPIPIYFMLGNLLTLALLLIFWKKWKKPGSKALFTFTLLFGFRFLIEFFRDPASNHGWGEMYLSLKVIQWAVLVITLALLFILLFNERSEVRKVPVYRAEQHIWRQTTFFVGLLLGVLALHDWFTPVEIITLQSILTFAALSMAWLVFRTHTHPSMRWATVAISFAGLITMGQTSPENANELFLENAPAGSTQAQDIISSVTFGFLGGTNNYSYLYDPDGSDDCDANHYEVGKEFYSTGIFYERLKLKQPNLYKGFGVGYHYTHYTISTEYGPFENKADQAGVLYLKWLKNQSLQIDAGLHFGQIRQHDGEGYKGDKIFPIFPYFNLRAGKPGKIFFELGIADDLPYGLMASSSRLGGGFSLPIKKMGKKPIISLGLTNIGDQRAFYLTPEVQTNRFSISLSGRFAKEKSNFGASLKYSFANQQKPNN